MARRLMTLWLAGALGVACFSACGGSSDPDPGTAGDAGARTGGGATASGGASGAGTSSGGRTNGGSANAGSANAGSANAGSANGGSASGGSASGGSGDGGSAEGGSSDGGAVCGGLRGASCTSEQWCDFADDAQCGIADQSGLCRPRPIACTKDCPGVCGCDGTTYCNRCEASAAGVDTAAEGACEPQSCTADENCGRPLRCCYPCGIPGCSMQCMRPAQNGECPLFP